MPGERWPDKRARAVLFAGANKKGRTGEPVDADAVAELGLAVRDLLFVDPEVREETVDAKAHRIGYSADCMQFATLEPDAAGVALGLWVGVGQLDAARAALGAERDPNPFRAHFGWVRVPLAAAADLEKVRRWVEQARAHAAQVKKEQAAPR